MNKALIGTLAWAALLLAGCPSKLPSDGRQVQIESAGDSWKIKDGGMLLLGKGHIPRRKDSKGQEILPVKAVVHKDVLYLLWADDRLDKWENPNR